MINFMKENPGWTFLIIVVIAGTVEEIVRSLAKR